MSAKHHYVSKFHLRQFLDVDSLEQRDPWLWQGFTADGSVKRRAPKNVGTKRLLFDGPGALLDRDTTLESFLAEEVETPAAEAMKEFCARPPGTLGIPPQLMRYLAWAAARTLAMQQLFRNWAKAGYGKPGGQLAEAPPEGLNSIPVQRPIAMVHPDQGRRDWPPESDFDRLAEEGWNLDYEDLANFREAVHVQAYYFQVRFFPRLHWSILRPPTGEFFVLADRAVGWCADGYVDGPPSILRHPSAYVLAPISKDLVLVGRHRTDAWRVTPTRINAVIACWAKDWIVGPTQSVVANALGARRRALETNETW